MVTTMSTPSAADVPTTYRSAVDRWLLVVLGAAMLVAGVSCGLAIFVGDAPALVIAGAAGALGIGLPAWVLTTTSYTLTSERLDVRSGPFRWRIPIAGIVDVAPTRNPLSAPALSLNRLRITTFGRPDLMISPADRHGFLDDLEARRAAAAGPGRGAR